MSKNNLFIGTILSSDNQHLTYPSKVLVNVIETDVNGSILQATVNTGEGSFVRASNAVYKDLIPLPGLTVNDVQIFSMLKMHQ